MEDFVVREYWSVQLRGEHVPGLVRDAVQEAREAVQPVTDSTATLHEVADRGLQETMSRFVTWAARHGIEVDGTREARMMLRFGGLDSYREARRALREGFRVWKDAGMDPDRFRKAEVILPNGGKTTA